MQDRTRLRAAFDQLDRDSSGAISKQNLKDALARLTLLNRVSRARKVIAHYIAHPWKPC